MLRTSGLPLSVGGGLLAVFGMLSLSLARMAVRAVLWTLGLALGEWSLRRFG